MFEAGEEYETVCGLKVRIYSTSVSSGYPIHGAFYKQGRWWPECWTENGRFSDKGRKSGMDIKRPNTRTVNVYEWP